MRPALGFRYFIVHRRPGSVFPFHNDRYRTDALSLLVATTELPDDFLRVEFSTCVYGFNIRIDKKKKK